MTVSGVRVSFAVCSAAIDGFTWTLAYPLSFDDVLGLSFLVKEDLKKEDLGLLRKYYVESFGFPYLLDLGGTIRSSTDLGDLW